MDVGLGAGRGYGSISHGLGSGTIGLGAVGLGLARGIGSPAATTSILALAKESLDDLVVYLLRMSWAAHQLEKAAEPQDSLLSSACAS